jgi:methylated-DNA-[protein]-cysteine S-methyltransferase
MVSMRRGYPGNLFFRSVTAPSFGPVVLLWTRQAGQSLICRVLLSKASGNAEARRAALFPDALRKSDDIVNGIALAISEILSGTPRSLPLSAAALADCPAFQRRVLEAEHAIPPGWVSSYRSLAVRLGSAYGSRAVGNALATNPFPLIVPCHRAVCSDGTLGGYQGGLDMKRFLLESEGIGFDSRGRIKNLSFFYS